MGRVSETAPGPAWLFCPADRPERYTKAAAVADVVILDLEDGVAPDDRPHARDALASTQLDPSRTIVRVSQHGTSDHERDVATLARTDYTCVLLSKCESAAQVESLKSFEVIALIETPFGALNINESVRANNLAGLMWGAEDLAAGFGAKSSHHPDGKLYYFARAVRTTTLLAAKAHNRRALDSAFVYIDDLAGLNRESADAAASGFDAKAAIHPRQVKAIQSAFAPTPEQIRWAQRLLQVALSQRGVFRFEGRMVDAALFKQAETICAVASRDSRAPGRLRHMRLDPLRRTTL